MANNRICDFKLKAIHQTYMQGNVKKRAGARSIKISRNTFTYYINKCEQLEKLHPIEMKNVNFYLSCLKEKKQQLSNSYLKFTELLPSIIQSLKDDVLIRKILWKNYRIQEPEGYAYSQFCVYFSNWCEEKGICSTSSKFRTQDIAQDDMILLHKWRLSNDRRKWEKAVLILDSANGQPLVKIASKLERSVRNIRKWLKVYKEKGLKALEIKPKRICHAISQDMENKKDNLIKLIHETPQLHGINRTSWRLVDLSDTYKEIYGSSMSTSTVSEYIKKQGYGFRKAKAVLTSPDPEFREKLNHIKIILSHLKENEKFFSVDEYGPFAIKKKGGRSLVKIGELRTYPQLQKSKGFIICTAALELSCNQITHFYSRKKNTEEMIKLLDLLLIKYKYEDKLYFSWDAASWHASKNLYNHIVEVNDEDYRELHHTPIVELAPLPASAQFLNVIESVFSGLAKSIIHNSDYQNIDECKTAIDQYFSDRNQYFINNPKRAGNKIWGKELVPPVFKDSQNCKNPRYR